MASINVIVMRYGGGNELDGGGSQIVVSSHNKFLQTDREEEGNFLLFCSGLLLVSQARPFLRVQHDHVAAKDTPIPV